jgi:hypothetical protein
VPVVADFNERASHRFAVLILLMMGKAAFGGKILKATKGIVFILADVGFGLVAPMWQPLCVGWSRPPAPTIPSSNSSFVAHNLAPK